MGNDGSVPVMAERAQRVVAGAAQARFGVGWHNRRMNPSMEASGRERALAAVAAVAARLVVEDGLGYEAARHQAAALTGERRAAQALGREQLDAAVREHIAVFCPESQARELAVLRDCALRWMERLAEFEPLLGGAVWTGTATRHSDVFLHLYADDPKAAEWRLLDRRVDYQPGSLTDERGESLSVLTVRERGEGELPWVLVHLVVHEARDRRGARRLDAQGQPLRGDAAALRARMASAEATGGAA